MRDDLVERNVAAAVRPPKQERADVRALTADEVKNLLARVKDDRLSAAYVVAVTTGLRQGEMLGLRWSDVDLEAGTLTIRNGLTRRDGEYRLEGVKTDRSRRTVTMPAMAATALRAHRVRQAEERLRAGKRWQGNDLVFTTPNGSPVNGTALTHALQRHCAAAGIPVIRWHDLRHTWASLSLAAGVPLPTLQMLGGWSSYAVLLSTYAHLLPDQANDAAARLDAVFGG